MDTFLNARDTPMKQSLKIIRKIVLMVAIFCYHFLVAAQNDTVKGQVNDNINNSIPLAHVMVFNADIFVLRTVTDFDGSFAIDGLKPGSYLLKIAAIGYADFVQEFTYEGDFLDFDILQLKITSIELDGVELVSRKKLYERRTNSLIINVEHHIASSGGSVLDILGSTAGVSINQQNNTLSLHGKGQISVMVDGKFSRIDGQALISLLKSMPASDNWKIETSNEEPFINTLETYFPESKIVTLSYTKNFGVNKKERKYKDNSVDEEKKRVQ